MRRTVVTLLLMVPLLLGLPLLGAWLDGHDLRQYLEFPPLTRYVEHAAFSWVGFVVFGLITAAGLACLAWGWRYGRRHAAPAPGAATGAPGVFPWWGWAGLAWGLLAWVMAWTRVAWFAPWQRLTFAPQWLGYILVVNALCEWRGRPSLLRRQPLGYLMLFPASAAFWWFFEYLNRYVQNWYYRGVETFSPVGYIAMATICFSTVLPAVLSTHDLLLTVPALGRGLSRGRRVAAGWARPAAWFGLLLAGAGLAAVGVLPSLLFGLLWVSPFLIVLAVQVLADQSPLLDELRRGDWRSLVAAPLAGLICGGFWELWNSLSLARWEYAVPFVNRFHIFEMPLLGYAGYLPFGLECLVMGRLVLSLVAAMRNPAPAAGSER